MNYLSLYLVSHAKIIFPLKIKEKKTRKSSILPHFLPYYRSLWIGNGGKLFGNATQTGHPWNKGFTKVLYATVPKKNFNLFFAYTAYTYTLTDRLSSNYEV